MRRRDIIALLCGAAIAAPVAARAQSAANRKRRIGILSNLPEADPAVKTRMAAFLAALRDAGWDGDGVTIDFRESATDEAKARLSARELIDLRPDIVVVQSTPLTAALLRETRTVPIVFVYVSDPVGARFVASLAHPGGNITGFLDLEFSAGGKWLQLLKEIKPSIERVAVMFNPDTAPFAQGYMRAVEAAASAAGMQATAAPVRDGREIEAAIAAFAWPDCGIILVPDIFIGAHQEQIIRLTAERRLPAIHPFRSYAVKGLLMSYGVDAVEQYRQAAGYVDRILRGTRPGDLPVQTPTTFQLVINLGTARALGLEVSPLLLARADEVIE